MRTTLYIFSLLWFVAGLVLLALATMLDAVPLLQILQFAPAAPDAHPLFGNYRTFSVLLAALAWGVVFCLPALLFAALGSLLERLDRLAKSPPADSVSREHAAPARKRVPAEKVEPRIGSV